MDKKEIILQKRYKIISELSRGGMGAVYLCTDLRLNCRVALKRMLSSEQFSSKRFQREASLLANIQHENLPNVTDYFSELNEHFLVMEYIEGSDLSDILSKRENPFTVEEINAWLPMLIDVLRFLHNQDPPIIHRDIKPSNIKLTPEGKLFLLDFGLAHGKAGLMKTQFSFSEVGFTPVFASLEQIQGEQTSELSDIFSLGATLYYLISKSQPSNALYRAAEIAKGKDDPLKLLDVDNLKIPVNKANAVYQCMSLDAGKRPKNINEFYNKWKNDNEFHLSVSKLNGFKNNKKIIITVSVITVFLILFTLIFFGHNNSIASDEIVTFNFKTRKYHCVTCEWAKKCTESCKNVPVSIAIKNGGRPCRVCNGRCK